MKAGSKAAKRRHRGGRPRKEGVERFDCGKIKPGETEREVKSVALEARMRIHLGVNDNDDQAARKAAESPYVGYTLGRIFLDGNITEGQRKAGDEFAEVMARYYSATGIPFPSARAQSLFSVKGHDGDVTESVQRRATRATNVMMDLTGQLLKCAEGPQVRQTVLNVVVMDYDGMRKMPPQQMRWLKRGLDRLQQHMGIAD